MKQQALTNVQVHSLAGRLWFAYTSAFGNECVFEPRTALAAARFAKRFGVDLDEVKL